MYVTSVISVYYTQEPSRSVTFRPTCGNSRISGKETDDNNCVYHFVEENEPYNVLPPLANGYCYYYYYYSFPSEIIPS